jgi:hypothetical protein
MPVGIIVEEPCHQHLNDEEDDNGSDVVLHSKDIVPVLSVKEAPEGGENRVGDSHSAVEWELRDLGAGELAVCVTELHNGLIVNALRCPGIDTVEAGLLNQVVDGWRFLEVDSARLDLGKGRLSPIWCNDELIELCAVAELIVDVLLIADELLLYEG